MGSPGWCGSKQCSSWFESQKGNGFQGFACFFLLCPFCALLSVVVCCWSVCCCWCVCYSFTSLCTSLSSHLPASLLLVLWYVPLPLYILATHERSLSTCCYCLSLSFSLSTSASSHTYTRTHAKHVHLNAHHPPTPPHAFPPLPPPTRRGTNILYVCSSRRLSRNFQMDRRKT